MKRLTVYTGNGKGKTTSALGLCLRALGQGQSVLVGQFMKSVESGEYKMQGLLPGYSVHLLGTPLFVKEPSPEDFKFAKDGLRFIVDKCLTEKPDLLILDEVNTACSYGLLEPSQVLKKLDLVYDIHIVMTGRDAPQSFIDKADYVVSYNEEKVPLELVCEKGREF